MFDLGENQATNVPPPIDYSKSEDVEQLGVIPTSIDHGLIKDLQETYAIKAPLQMRYNPDETQ
jgi:hypothetical protein